MRIWPSDRAILIILGKWTFNLFLGLEEQSLEMMTFSLEEFKIKQCSLPNFLDCGHLVHHKFHTKWLFCILKFTAKNKPLDASRWVSNKPNHQAQNYCCYVMFSEETHFVLWTTLIIEACHISPRNCYLKKQCSTFFFPL